MKSWIKNSLYSICCGCMALSFFFVSSGVSMIFFGEPEFPSEN